MAIHNYFIFWLLTVTFWLCVYILDMVHNFHQSVKYFAQELYDR